MYVPEEEQKGIANDVANLFFDKNMVSFSKRSTDLYKKYGEFTADDIMLKVRDIILTKNQKDIA